MSGFEEEHFVPASRLAAITGLLHMPTGARGQKNERIRSQGMYSTSAIPSSVRSFCLRRRYFIHGSRSTRGSYTVSGKLASYGDHHVITKKKAEARAMLRVACKGVSKDDFWKLHGALKGLGFKVTVRNPSPVAFDAKAVAELFARVANTAIAGYAVKKVIDAAQKLVIAYIKFKFMTSSATGQRRTVTLYGARGEVFEYKDKKIKKEK
jgi:hypothetical protein